MPALFAVVLALPWPAASEVAATPLAPVNLAAGAPGDHAAGSESDQSGPLQDPVGVCDRTSVVRHNIMSDPAVTAGDCSLVTSAELAQVSIMDLERWDLTSLKAHDFEGLTGLKMLDMCSNPMWSLPAGIFDDLTRLTELHMYDLRLTSLPEGLFHSLTSLQTLLLYNNNWHTAAALSLHDGVFNNLTSLQTLDLHRNKLPALPAGVFDDLTSLQTLDLSSNALTTLPAGVFDKMTKLQSLDLIGNHELATLPAGVFDKLTSLTKLLLHSAPITTLPAGVFDKLTSLQTLDLSNVTFSTFPEGVFDNLTSLQTLDLRWLQIPLPEGVFDNLTSLQSLDLRWSPNLSYSPYLLSPLTNLRRLDDQAYTRPAAPGAPTGLTATHIAGTVKLSWTAPATGGAATSYRILRRAGSAAREVYVSDTYDPDTVAVTYTDTGVTAGQSYQYYVQALNAGGAGAESSPAMVTVPRITLPAAPTGLTATADGQTRIELAWSAPGDTGGAAITGYWIQQSQDGGTTWSDLAADTGGAGVNYIHSGLTAASTRHFRVAAINQIGPGGWSNVASTKTDAVAATAPDPPANLQAAPDGPTRIALQWTVPASDGGSAITGYRIEVSEDGGETGGATWSDLVAKTGPADVSYLSGTRLQYRHGGVPAGSTRHYRVYAINGVGASSASNEASAAAPLESAVSIAAAAILVTEGEDAAFTLTRTGGEPYDAALTVAVSVTEVGAVIETADSYQPPATVAFAASAATATLTVKTADDAVVEMPGVITAAVTAAAAADYTPGDPASAAVTVADNDTAVMTLTVSPTTIPEAGGVATVSVEITNGVTYAADQEISIGLFGTAERDSDYTVAAERLTLTAGANTVATTVTAVDDEDHEDDETILITASRGSVTVGTRTIWIMDDDEEAPTVTLVLSAGAIGEDGGSATVTASLDHSSSAATTVTVAAAAVLPAVEADFTMSGDSLTIAAGATASGGALTIAAVDNDVDAPDKEVLLSALAANSQGVAGNPTPVTLTITDDEEAPAVSLELSRNAIGENGGSATVTARLEHPSSAATTVRVAAAAVLPAVEADFTMSGDRLTIAAGATASGGALTIAAVDNDVDAPDQAVLVSAAAANVHGVTAPPAVTLTITDDEGAPAVSLELSQDAIGENGGSATVTARLEHPSSAATTMTVAAAAVMPAVAADFTLSGDRLTIAAGATASGAMIIRAVDNDVDAPDTEVRVAATAANSHGVAGDPPAVTLAITDDEQTPEVTLELSAESIAEYRGSSTVTAKLERPSSAATTVTVSAVAIAPALSGDFTLSGDSLTIAAGATAGSGALTITPVNNEVDAPNKEVRVAATAVNSHGVTAPAAVILTIIDDEGAPTVTLELSPDAIGESGGFGTVTAKLNHPSSAATTLTLAAAPVVPALATDFTLQRGQPDDRGRRDGEQRRTDDHGGGQRRRRARQEGDGERQRAGREQRDGAGRGDAGDRGR